MDLVDNIILEKLNSRRLRKLRDKYREQLRSYQECNCSADYREAKEFEEIIDKIDEILENRKR